jgi:ABC-type phosphate transport system substrate-binding protein
MRLTAARTFGLGVAVAALAVSGCSRKGGREDSVVTIKGSDTMVHLCSTWAEDYMKANQGIEVPVPGDVPGRSNEEAPTQLEVPDSRTRLNGILMPGSFHGNGCWL